MADVKRGLRDYGGVAGRDGLPFAAFKQIISFLTLVKAGVFFVSVLRID